MRGVREVAAAGLQFPLCLLATWSGVMTPVLLLFHLSLSSPGLWLLMTTLLLCDPQEPSSARIYLITIGGLRKPTDIFLITSSHKEDRNKLSFTNRSLHYPENCITLHPLLPELSA